MAVPGPLDWIPAGQRFGPDDMVFFAGHGERELDDVLADIDLIVTGPHASAAFPEEMAPFVDPRLTRRLQYDFTDVSTSPMARRWAEIDPEGAVHRGSAPAGRARRQPPPPARPRRRPARGVRAAR